MNRQREVRVARGSLESFLRRVKRELGRAKSDVTVCLISDAEMARLNWSFRKKKGPTDVLSFPSERQSSRGARMATRGARKKDRAALNTEAAENAEKRRNEFESASLGDIAISPATARRYAKKNARTLANELRVLVLHGVLHLLGYDHETDNGEMDRVEQKLRRRLGIA